jgi:hypothetical protein
MVPAMQAIRIRIAVSLALCFAAGPARAQFWGNNWNNNSGNGWLVVGLAAPSSAGCGKQTAGANLGVSASSGPIVATSAPFCCKMLSTIRSHVRECTLFLMQFAASHQAAGDVGRPHRCAFGR